MASENSWTRRGAPLGCPPRVTMKRAFVIALCIVAAACASAGQNNGFSDAPQSDGPIHHDAHPPGDAGGHLDSALPADAAVPHDGALPVVDAPGGQLCVDNTGCTDTGTCCYFFVCTPGTGFGSN